MRALPGEETRTARRKRRREALRRREEQRESLRRVAKKERFPAAVGSEERGGWGRKGWKKVQGE